MNYEATNMKMNECELLTFCQCSLTRNVKIPILMLIQPVYWFILLVETKGITYVILLPNMVKNRIGHSLS